MAATRRNFPAPRNYIPAVSRARTEMRITFVNGLYPPHGAGGAETTLRWLASQLAARGHICSVATLSPDRKPSAGTIDGIPVHYLPLTNLYWPHAVHRPSLKRPLFQALDAYNPVMGQRVRHLLAELKPDVVHSHNLQGFSVAAWTAAASLGIPIVQTIHDYYLACPRSAMWRPGKGNCSSPCMECRLFSTPRRMLTRLPGVVTAVSLAALVILAAGPGRAAPSWAIDGDPGQNWPVSGTLAARTLVTIAVTAGLASLAIMACYQVIAGAVGLELAVWIGAGAALAAGLATGWAGDRSALFLPAALLAGCCAAAAYLAIYAICVRLPTEAQVISLLLPSLSLGLLVTVLCAPLALARLRFGTPRPAWIVSAAVAVPLILGVVGLHVVIAGG